MKKIPLLALSALALLAVPAPVRADELIRFKSGYEMMALSHREGANGMILITLPDGGEVGFKRDLLELLEEGKPASRTGPPPRYNMATRTHNNKSMAPPEELPSRFLAKGSTSYNGQTVGYSYHDQKFERFSGGPIGEVNSSGRIGVDVRTRGHGKGNASTDAPKQKGQKSATRTVEFVNANEGE